jgi:hypothetical protein
MLRRELVSDGGNDADLTGPLSAATGCCAAGLAFGAAFLTAFVAGAAV